MKTLLRIALVLLLVFVGLIGLAIATLDGTFARAVEESGTYAMGVPTHVESADVGLFSGELSMVGLNVDNPEGFETPHFLELGGTALAVDTASFGTDKLVVPLIEFTEVALNLERRDGKTNYGVILDNLARFSSDEPAGEPQESTPDGEPGQAILIQRISLRDIKATVDLLPIGGEASKITLGLEELEITDLDTAGMTLEELFSLVVNTLLAATLESGEGLLPADLLKDLGGHLEGLEATAFQLKGELQQEVEGALAEQQAELLDKAGTKLEEVGGEAGKALGDKLGTELEKGLGGLLKKD